MKRVSKEPIVVPEPVYARAKALCKEQGVSMSEWLEDLIDCAVSARVVEPKARPAHLPRTTFLRKAHAN